jgi:hypothetical protein
MGIRDKPIAPGSPWQNGFAERLIGSIRRECVDHIVVLGETHLRRILKSYARYYNETRTHRSLDKDAPISRPGRVCGLPRDPSDIQVEISGAVRTKKEMAATREELRPLALPQRRAPNRMFGRNAEIFLLLT